MEDSLKTYPNPSDSTKYQDGLAFKKSFGLLGLVLLTCVLAQHVLSLVNQNINISGLGVLAAIVMLAGLFAVFGKQTLSMVATPPFNVSNLAVMALATALGTFFPQKAAGGHSIAQFFHLDDIFHSWWYVSLFALLALGLIKISSRKSFNLHNIGFHLAHLSPVLILAGFWVDHFLGFRGIIKLEEGGQKNTVLLYQGASGQIYDSTALDFNIRLDQFEFGNHKPDYRIQLWKMDTSSHAVKVSQHGQNPEESIEIVSTFPLEQGKIQKIFGTDMRFRLATFYPDFEFEYQYPVLADTVLAHEPGIMIDLKTAEGDAFLQLFEKKGGRNKLVDMVGLGASLEFYWELPTAVNEALSNPAGQPDNWIIFEGKNAKIHFLVDGKVKMEPLTAGKFFSMPAHDTVGFSVRYLMPNVNYLQAIPSTKSDELNNPVAKVEVWKKGGPAQEVFLYPNSTMRRGGSFRVPGTAHILTMDSQKDKETKFYRSDLSVVDNDGEVVKQQSIIVNEPMLHRGYRFYQTDYDPNNPAYSGIGVSHDPGLGIIYTGFFLLMAGVAHMFYMKKLV